MIVRDETEIPNPKLRAIYRLWARRRRDGGMPRRCDITLDDLRGAAAHILFCTAEKPFRGLSSLKVSNAGTGFVDAVGLDPTGATIAEVLADLGSTPAFTKCFTEYATCYMDRVCSYNEGNFPGLEKGWLGYQRLVMPLGDAEGRAAGLFVACDFADPRYGLRLPASLQAAQSEA